jgi:hypothetical protein
MGISIQAYTCPWSSLFFSNGKAFCWGSFNYCWSKLYITLLSHLMLLILSFIFNTFPPYQFGVVIKRGCEEVVHGINAPLISILIGCSHKLMLPMHLNVLYVVMF